MPLALLLAPILAPVLALGAAAPLAGSKSEATLILEGSHAEVTAPAASGVGMSWHVHLRRYMDRLRDDATPYALQPFLQRAVAIEAFASAGTRDLPPPGGSDAAPLGDFFVVGGGLSNVPMWRSPLLLSLRVSYAHRPGAPTEHAIRIDGAVGLRLGDFQISAHEEAFEGLGGPHGFGVWFRGTLDLRVVLLEHIELQASVTAWNPGLFASFHGAYYPSKRLGLEGGGFGGGLSGAPVLPDEGMLPELRGGSPVPVADAIHFGVLVGLSYWWSRRFGISARFSPTWISGAAAAAADQRVTLAISARN